MRSTPEEIQTALDDMAVASGALEDEVVKICFFMRGSIDWDQAWRLTQRNRKRIFKRIKENIENTEKTGLPLI